MMPIEIGLREAFVPRRKYALLCFSRGGIQENVHVALRALYKASADVGLPSLEPCLLPLTYPGLAPISI